MTETQEIIYTGAEGIFARWKVARRSRVGPDTVLFTYKVGSEERKFLNPEAVGVVQRLGALKAGITLQKG